MSVARPPAARWSCHTLRSLGGITGDANLPRNMAVVTEIETSSGVQLSGGRARTGSPGVTSARTEVRRLNRLS